MDNSSNSVLFWRNGKWHAGWLQQRHRDDGLFTVAWLEDGRMYAKAVDKFVHLSNIDAAILQRAPE